MLILSRKVGQRIVIGDSIEITVVQVRGDHVRLGITAPRSVVVHRKELLERIAAENAEPADPLQHDAKAPNNLLPESARE